jgi:hypothetical protein
MVDVKKLVLRAYYCICINFEAYIQMKQTLWPAQHAAGLVNLIKNKRCEHVGFSKHSHFNFEGKKEEVHFLCPAQSAAGYGGYKKHNRCEHAGLGVAERRGHASTFY